MSKNTIIAGVVILLVLIGGWYLLKPKSTTTENPQTAQTPLPQESASPSAASEGAMMKKETMVSITSTGFSPKTITVKAGDSVTWTNNDSANHNVNSDPHPTHTLYPFLNLGTIKPGDKKSATFEKAGTYTYHDHLNPSLTGTVTVE